jgi:glutamate formiminotransferase
VRAMGVDLPELGAVQVSMNLTDYARTSMLDAFRAVEAAAAARGIAVLRGELVGLAPQQALPPDAERALKLTGFNQDQILERRLGMA